MTLLEIRKEKGLSQRQMAEMLGVDVTLISHIERGTRTMTDAVKEKVKELFGEIEDSVVNKEEKTETKVEDSTTKEEVKKCNCKKEFCFTVRDFYAAAFLCGIADKIDIRNRRADYLPDIAARIFDVADVMVKARGYKE